MRANIIQYFLKEFASLSSLLAECESHVNSTIYVYSRETKRGRESGESEEGETPHACLRIVYPLFISQNLKIIPHLIRRSPPPLPRVLFMSQ